MHAEILSSLTDPVAAFAADTLEHLAGNPAFESCFGPPGPLATMVPELDIARMWQRLERRGVWRFKVQRAELRAPLELEIRRLPAGAVLLHGRSLEPVLMAEATSKARLDTAQKTERRLERQLHRCRSLIEAFPDAVWLFDRALKARAPATGAAGGHFMGPALLAISALLFSGVAWFAWAGQLGLIEMVLLLFSTITFFLGRRKIGAGGRKKVDLVAKIVFTVVGCMALLRHPIEVEGSGKLPLYEAIAAYIDQVDRTTFITWALVAMGVKFVGVISSAYAWNLLLRGQGVRFPFWSKIMTAFLIGRFIGTFLPSTLGLDGYTLYEAGRYSNEWPRVITAKALEKFIGVTGLFLGMVVTMPSRLRR